MADNGLTKTCLCVTHDEPHWYHMQKIMIRSTETYIERTVARGVTNPGIIKRVITIKERHRLAELIAAMERYGWNEIPEQFRQGLGTDFVGAFDRGMAEYIGADG